MMEREENLLLKYNLQFFAKDGPGGEKTEEPTAKKLEDARKEVEKTTGRPVVAQQSMFRAV